jgi:hypothetical protein
MMLSEIVIDLARQGAPGAKVTIEGETPAEDSLLTLECSECWEPGRPEKGSKRERRTWQAASFTACPKCGKRETVGKAPAVPEPEQATV